MNPHDVLSLCYELPPIVLRDPLLELYGLLAVGEPVRVRLGDLLKQDDLFHPHVAAAFRLCALAAATVAEMMEGVPSRDDLLVVVRGQQRDLSNGLLGRVFSLVFGAHGEDGFKGFGPHHRRRRRLWFEQEDFDYNTIDVIHWQSGYGARVRFEPEELPYSIPLNNLIFAQGRVAGGQVFQVPIASGIACGEPSR